MRRDTGYQAVIMDELALLGGLMHAALVENGFTYVDTACLRLSEVKKVIDLEPDLIVLNGNLSDPLCLDILKSFQLYGLSRRVLLIASFRNEAEVAAGMALGIRAFSSRPIETQRIIDMAKLIISQQSN